MIKNLFFIVAFLFVPLTALAAESSFFGPIVPAACNCPDAAPEWGCVLEVIRNLMNFGISFGVIIIVLMLAYAGFMFIMSAANAEMRSKGKQAVTNAVIGLLIMLSAWLIVDFVMKQFYNPSSEFGPWNSILSGGEMCIVATEPTKIAGLPSIINNVVTGFVPSDNGTVIDPGWTDPNSDGKFEYQTENDRAQAAHASARLNSLLSCMATKVPAGVGQISDISDQRLVPPASKTFAQCVQGGCGHAAGSCHYGGRGCTGQSYAVDFGDEQNMAVLSAAAKACGADFVNPEGNHLHLSVGKACGCN